VSSRNVVMAAELLLGPPLIVVADILGAGGRVFFSMPCRFRSNDGKSSPSRPRSSKWVISDKIASAPDSEDEW